MNPKAKFAGRMIEQPKVCVEQALKISKAPEASVSQGMKINTGVLQILHYPQARGRLEVECTVPVELGIKSS